MLVSSDVGFWCNVARGFQEARLSKCERGPQKLKEKCARSQGLPSLRPAALRLPAPRPLRFIGHG